MARYSVDAAKNDEPLLARWSRDVHIAYLVHCMVGDRHRDIIGLGAARVVLASGLPTYVAGIVRQQFWVPAGCISW